MSNHIKTKDHQALAVARQQGIANGFLYGNVVMRAAHEDPHTIPLHRWVASRDPIGRVGGGGAAAAAASQSAPFYVRSGAETLSDQSTNASCSQCGHRYGSHRGYDNRFSFPVIKTADDRQKLLNYHCGMIARGGRTISIGECAGFRSHVNALRPNWVVPERHTVADNLLAMYLKRMNDLARVLKDTKETTVTRHVRLDSSLILPYLHPELRGKAEVPVPSAFNALTYDMWNRRHGSHFLGMAVHSLGVDFVESPPRLAFFREFQQRHLGDNVACAVDTFHAELGVGGCFFEAAVLDGGGDVQKAARVCNNRPAQIHKCSVHTLQRVVIQGVGKAKALLNGQQIYPIKRLLKRGNKLVRICKNASR